MVLLRIFWNFGSKEVVAYEGWLQGEVRLYEGKGECNIRQSAYQIRGKPVPRCYSVTRQQF